MSEPQANDNAPDVAATGSAGTQTPAPAGTALVAKSSMAAVSSDGLKPFWMPDLVGEIAESEMPEHVKTGIAVSALARQVEAHKAEIQARADKLERENAELRRALDDARDTIGTLRGDVRVLKVKLRHADSDRTDRAIQAGIGNVLMAVGGGFVLGQPLAGIIFLLAGAALFYRSWFGKAKEDPSVERDKDTE